jgi:hypothetical protein
MEIKERGIANIEKEKRITLIVAEFYIKLNVCRHIRNFLLIELPFNFEIVAFVLRIKYDSEKIIQIESYKHFVRRLSDTNVLT